ncbi:MAG: hypothetical protein H8D54_02255 [Candidatus Omnitrophica bacterium]|nr:hypothetical protein [Candidatus Omnitrophota bacterium]
MVRKTLRVSLLTVMLISLGFFTLKGFSRETSASKDKDMAQVSEKVDEVLKNQQDIIARLEDIRAQQDVIRVRASRR